MPWTLLCTTITSHIGQKKKRNVTQFHDLNATHNTLYFLTDNFIFSFLQLIVTKNKCHTKVAMLTFQFVWIELGTILIDSGNINEMTLTDQRSYTEPDYTFQLPPLIICHWDIIYRFLKHFGRILTRKSTIANRSKTFSIQSNMQIFNEH